MVRLLLPALAFSATIIAPLLALLARWNAWAGWAVIAVVVTVAILVRPD